MNLSRQIEDGVAALACNFRAFLAACLIIVIWAASGPHYGYSDTWQLIINTGTTIVTFLMVFLVGANQQRADTTRRAVLERLEEHTSLWERHAEETHALMREMQRDHRRVMAHLGLIEAELEA